MNLATGPVVVNTLRVTTGTGSIQFVQVGARNLTVTNGTTADGAIAIGNVGADLTAGTVTAGGTGRSVMLTTATAGSVLVDNVTAAGDQVTITSAAAINESGNDPAADVTAARLLMTAASGIGQSGNLLETAVSNLEAVGGSGGIYLSNLGPLTIGGISTMVGVSASGGNIVITSVGLLFITENVNGAADITLTAGEGAARTTI